MKKRLCSVTEIIMIIAIYSLRKRFDKQQKKLEERTRKMKEISGVKTFQELKAHKQKSAETEL